MDISTPHFPGTRIAGALLSQYFAQHVTPFLLNSEIHQDLTFLPTFLLPSFHPPAFGWGLACVTGWGFPPIDKLIPNWFPVLQIAVRKTTNLPAAIFPRPDHRQPLPLFGSQICCPVSSLPPRGQEELLQIAPKPLETLLASRILLSGLEHLSALRSQRSMYRMVWRMKMEVSGTVLPETALKQHSKRWQHQRDWWW